jgi:hypothetical protein
MIDFPRIPSRILATARLLVIPLVAASFIACEDGGDADDGTAGRGDTTAAATMGGDADPVKRGEYLVTVMGGCIDCHTPFKMGAHGAEPDMTLLMSGHPESLKMPPPPDLGQGPWVWSASGTNTAFSGPWGVSYSMNLTPDTVTGIGNWTEEQIIAALRTGKHMGVSRPIMPPMPWQNLSRATEEDLKAIYAYLRSIPPIKNQVPDIVPPPGGMPGGAPAGGASGDTAAAAGDTTK